MDELIYGLSGVSTLYFFYKKIEYDFDNGKNTFFSRLVIPLINFTLSEKRKIKNENDFERILTNIREGNSLVKYTSSLVQDARLQNSLNP